MLKAPAVIVQAQVHGRHLLASNDPHMQPDEQSRRERHHFDEYESGLDDVPTARMERARPERWTDL